MDAFAWSMSAVNWAPGSDGTPPLVPSASPATRIPPAAGSSTAMLPAVWPGAVMTWRSNTTSPSWTGVRARGTVIPAMSSAPA